MSNHTERVNTHVYRYELQIITSSVPEQEVAFMVPDYLNLHSPLYKADSKVTHTWK